MSSVAMAVPVCWLKRRDDKRDEALDAILGDRGREMMIVSWWWFEESD
jgi:hypothetical protein